MRKRRKVCCGWSFCRWLTGGWHLFVTNNVKAKVYQPILDVLWWSGEWKMSYHSLYRLLGFGIDGEVWEVTDFKVRVDSWKILHFMTTLVLFLVLQNSKLPLSKPPSCPCNCIRFTWEFSAIRGSLPAWLDGTYCCWPSVESSALFPWSASISVDIREAKKFQVGTSSFDCNWGVVCFRGGCCWLLGSFVDLVWRLPLSSSLLAEFFNGWRFSTGGLGCLPFGSALFGDCCHVV
jgi:hypothetical protein